MKKTIILIIAVIVVMIVGIIIGKNTIKSQPTSSNTVEKNPINTVENATNNNINTETNINVEENIIEQEEKKEEEPKTDLEKAIHIVKKDWGEDSTVYFAQDGQTNNGEYIICVREKETTRAKAWYTVNVEDETYTRE